jgi:hypothetical protein
MESIMRAWLFLVCVLLGCAQPTQTIRDDGGIVLDDSPITIHDNAAPQEFVLTMAAPSSLFETIRKFLPPNAKVTIEVPQPHTISGGAGKVTLPTVTQFTLSSDAKLITGRFKSPQPVITSELFAGIKATPFMPTVQIRPDDTVAIEAQGTLYHKWIVREIDTAGADVKQLPEVWAWSMPACGPCEAAKKAIAAADDLPFRVIWKTGAPPARLGLESRPCFWWSVDTDKPDGSKTKTKTIEGWHSLKHLREQWERSRSPTEPRSLWSVDDDWNPSRAKLIDHLLHGGNHRGRFERHKLETMSRDELLRLHAVDHERRD